MIHHIYLGRTTPQRLVVVVGKPRAEFELRLTLKASLGVRMALPYIRIYLAMSLVNVDLNTPTSSPGLVIWSVKFAK